MYKTFVYKLRPNKEQERILAETLETCRHLYNHCLAERKQAWEERGESVSRYQQSACLPALRSGNEYLARAYAQVLQNVIRRVDVSYQNFFRRVKEKRGKPGFPRFKGRGWYDSFVYPQYAHGWRIKDGRLDLRKIGDIRLFFDRPLGGKPKTCTIRRRVDGWYACICCEVGPNPLPETGESVGIDMGLEYFATLSTGEHIANPRYLRRAEGKLKTAQRRLTRRKIGSNRRRKARVLLAKAHMKVRRARLDHAHKAAREIVSRFDEIAVEDLSIQNMLKWHPVAKSIADAGWGIFLRVLREKAESAARAYIEVSPAGTSQDCSGCGERVPKRLSERWHSCPYCGLEMQRDVNAALNIRKKGGGTAFGEAAALAVA